MLHYLNAFALATVVFLAGCATVPETARTYEETAIKVPDPGKGILVFYRTLAPPTAYEMRVIIDGEQVVSLPNEAFSWVQLDLGRHTLKVDWNNWSGMPSKRYDINLKAGGENYLELNAAQNVVPIVDLIVHYTYKVEENEDEAAVIHEQRKIQKCCRYVPSKSPAGAGEIGP